MKNRKLLKTISWTGLTLAILVSFLVNAEGLFWPFVGLGYALLYSYGKVNEKMPLLVGSMIATIYYIFSLQSVYGLVDVILWGAIFYLVYNE